MPFIVALLTGLPLVSSRSIGGLSLVSRKFGRVGLEVGFKEIFLLPDLCDSVLFQIANIFVQIELRNIAGITLWSFNIFHNVKMPKRLVILAN